MATEDSMYEHWLYLACEECQTVYNGDCAKHPLEFIRHVPVPTGDLQRPIKTLPDILYIAPSIQKPGRLGVFTSEILAPRLAFGPYEGVRIYDTAKTSPYTWRLAGDRPPLNACDRSLGPSAYKRPFLLDGRPPGHWHGEPFLIDGRPLGQSNWMRYVQAAQYEEEQNLIAFSGYDGNIYYRTRQAIQRGQELVVRKAGPFGWQPFAVQPLEEADPLPEGVVLCATCKKVGLGSDQRCHECTDELKEPSQSRHCSSTVKRPNEGNAQDNTSQMRNLERPCESGEVPGPVADDPQPGELQAPAAPAAAEMQPERAEAGRPQRPKRLLAKSKGCLCCQ